ncbi:hypothetical protein OXYTRIMIC_019 [Oxytricha trifallax]|uniref:Uncharacterized protein n=1 Tax=Oxytricha trifallax TaxID=1172189 RepID=A0A073I0H7_9SPIT|nr:hypothetical protein OXYTRIMIC_019 [Oxytricha trifallax]
MEEYNKPFESKLYQSHDNRKRNFKCDDIDQKAHFWQKVKEVRYEHRNMQRYDLMFNLEVGLLKLEIGKSGITIEEKTMEIIRERKNEMLWQAELEENGTQNKNMYSQFDVCEMVLKNGSQMYMEKVYEEQEGGFSEKIVEGAYVEEYLFPRTELDKEKTENINGAVGKSKLIQTKTKDEPKNSGCTAGQDAVDQKGMIQDSARTEEKINQQCLNEEEVEEQQKKQD